MTDNARIYTAGGGDVTVGGGGGIPCYDHYAAQDYDRGSGKKSR